MKLVIIGRTEMLYNTTVFLANKGHSIPLIITAKAAPEYTKTEKDFKKLSDSLGAEYIYTQNVNKDKIISKVRRYEAELGISINWINTIKHEFIDAFRLGILNAHAGDLPKYRGNACLNWAILNGEKQIVLSIHYMEGGELDSGDIICQRKYRLTSDVTIGDIHNWASLTVVDLFCDAIEKLQTNPGYILKKQSDNPKDALRCYPRIPADSEIDWNQSAEYIHRLIKASSEPLLGAYTFMGTEKLIVWKAHCESSPCPFLGMPGQVAERRLESGEVLVITGEDFLVLEEIETQSRGRKKATGIIKSSRTKLGMDITGEFAQLKERVAKLERVLEEVEWEKGFSR